MSIIGCAGSDEPGANFTPPTLGLFMKNQELETRRLREARAGAQVVKEAREFHERRALHFGVHSPRGLAHYKASRMYTREGSRLQEMFENGGEIGELPSKAVIKANKAAMGFHKKQAEKAGLDSDLGHAHVAAMEHHADIIKKAKAQHQQQGQPEVGNGPMDSGGKGVPMKQSKREALPGHGSKQSPVPVPKKSEQPNEDIHDPTAPPVSLNPEDANKQPRKLQQGKEWGPKFGPSKGWGTPMKASKRRKRIANFGRESNVHDRVNADMDCTLPKGAGRQMQPDLVYRGPRTKEARRRRHL